MWIYKKNVKNFTRHGRQKVSHDPGEIKWESSG